MPYESTLLYTRLPRSGLALGGIGTGSFELRQDGAFYHWGIFNNYPQFTGARLPFTETSVLFFKVRYQEPGKPPRIKLLQIDSGYFVAGMSNPVYEFPWMSGIQQIDYSASFPFTTLRYVDDELPFSITLEAFSPFIPLDVKNSALPAAIFNFRVAADRPVALNLMMSMRSGVGYDVSEKLYATRVIREPGLTGVVMTCDGIDRGASSFGSQAIYSLADESRYYAGWGHRHPYYEIILRQPALPDVDDTANRNPLDHVTGERRALDSLYSTIGLARSLEPGQSLDHTFVTTWHFPNLYSASGNQPAVHGDRREGHFYNNFFADAHEVGRYIHVHLADLSARTRQFHQQFYDSTLDPIVLDQINSHLNTFVAGGWLTEDGAFGIQEGLTDTTDWGPVGTIDVGLYGSIAALSLFPDLDRAMITAHCRLQKPSGEISHGIPRDFGRFEETGDRRPRADLTAQYALMALRHYLWTNDRDFLTQTWESITRALAFSMREQDDDQDGIPDMHGEGSSYDNFSMWGASAYVATLWLSALQHAQIAARVLGDTGAEAQYSGWFQQAFSICESRLWNGSHYRLYHDASGGHGQDEGCLTDQLIGEWIAHQTGAPFVVSDERRRAVFQRILALSYEPGFGLRNCSWKEDTYLHEVPADCWYDQANTLWSGVELGFASLLIYEGFVAEAFELIRTVDRRYRRAGRYFDHQEWGGHYYRAQSAWGILAACAGLCIHAEVLQLAPRLHDDHVRLMIPFGQGIMRYDHDAVQRTAQIRVLAGRFPFRQVIYTPPWPVTDLGRASINGTPVPTRLESGAVVLEPVPELASDHVLTMTWG